MKSYAWPEGKRFAFTVFDDTDLTTIENGPPVYGLLRDLGFRTTKSVWPLQGTLEPLVGGSTCAEPDYLNWIRDLRDQGFEIALHNVTYHTSTRDQIRAGLERFKQFFGDYPKIHVNHTGCEDALYWGQDRLSGVNRLLYNLLTRFGSRHYRGHVEGSDLFWGDYCKEKIQYVRNFVYGDVNTLKACPWMPYFDRRRPYVNRWFASAEGADVHAFNKMLSERNQDRLESEGGACIMYTHFGKDFYENGQLNARFKQLMERLSRKDGWFVPVSTLLDYLQQVRGLHPLTGWQRFKLEMKWLLSKCLVGGTS